MRVHLHKQEELLKEQIQGPRNAVSGSTKPSRNPLPYLSTIIIWEVHGSIMLQQRGMSISEGRPCADMGVLEILSCRMNRVSTRTSKAANCI